MLSDTQETRDTDHFCTAKNARWMYVFRRPPQSNGENTGAPKELHIKKKNRPALFHCRCVFLGPFVRARHKPSRSVPSGCAVQPRRLHLRRYGRRRQRDAEEGRVRPPEEHVQALRRADHPHLLGLRVCHVPGVQRQPGGELAVEGCGGECRTLAWLLRCRCVLCLWMCSENMECQEELLVRVASGERRPTLSDPPMDFLHVLERSHTTSSCALGKRGATTLMHGRQSPTKQHRNPPEIFLQKPHQHLLRRPHFFTLIGS